MYIKVLENGNIVVCLLESQRLPRMSVRAYGSIERYIDR